jgi:hypothetical protein
MLYYLSEAVAVLNPQVAGGKAAILRAEALYIAHPHANRR